MRKSFVWILAVLVTIALVGLVSIQLYWIRSAIYTKEAQFDMKVNSALNDMVLLLQKEETALHLIKEINKLPSASGALQKIRNQSNKHNQKHKIALNFSKEVNLNSHNTNKLSAKVSVVPANSANNQYKSQNNQTCNINKQLVNNNGNINQRSLINKKQLIENILNKLLQSHINIDERIDELTLVRVIKSGLLYRGINLDFEYAVKNDDNDISFKSESYSDSAAARMYLARLFPEDIFDKPNFLTIYFPNRQSYIYQSMGFMIFSSITLTSIIIIVLTITIWVILKQKRLSEIKTDFINNMTHELKTPISTISLASQMICDTSISKELKNTDQLGLLILEESKRLGMQVEKVLQMAVYEKGSLKLKLKEVNINNLIENILNNFNIQVKSRNGQIIKELNALTPVAIIDEMHITNAIINLLDNAVKYCSTEPIIVVSTQNKGNYIIIEVKDNGIGINKENQKRLFEQFYRVPTGNLHNVRGFGLGLNYVKKIVEAHKGIISVNSKPGHGSVFAIHIIKKAI